MNILISHIFTICTSLTIHLVCPPPPPQIWYKHCLQFLLGQVCKTQEKLKRKVMQYSGRGKQGVQMTEGALLLKVLKVFVHF